MLADPVATRIGEILGLLAEQAGSRPEPPGAVSHLNDLFDVLHDAERSEERAQAEELIWALWCSHENPEAARALQKATGAMNRRELEVAEVLLDGLVDEYPRWAEAWNKRATVRFMAEHDLASLDDIARTLELEPRHFGAICGLAQICLRNDDEISGLAAFQFALQLNPNLRDVESAIKALQERLQLVLH